MIGSVQSGKLHTQLLSMFCLNAFSAARDIEIFQAFVLEGLDHFPSVACCATQSSRITVKLTGAKPVRA